MVVKIEERERINKIRFGDIAPGTIFRMLRLGDNGAYVVDGLETFYMKLLSVSERYDKCNAILLCGASKSNIDDDEVVQPFEEGVLTVWE